MSAPRFCIKTASRAASERRPWYFKAWTIARSAPSYAPIARARSTWRARRQQDRLSGGNLDAFRIPPQAFEAVEHARFRGEDVDDEIKIIEQHPFGAVVPLDVRRLHAFVGERRHHGVGDRPDLARIAP